MATVSAFSPANIHWYSNEIGLCRLLYRTKETPVNL